MNTKLLQMLQDLLLTIPKRNFDLGSWRKNSEYFYQPTIMQIEYGSICCAVGWACTHEPFKAIGLSYYDNRPHLRKDGEIYRGWNAVFEFFEINPCTAAALFYVDLYSEKHVKPIDVINRIQELISWGESKFNEVYPNEFLNDY